MVESTQGEGDGVNRPTKYANFRTDQEPIPGYSAELISKLVDPDFYDNLDDQPKPREGIETLL